MLRKRIELHSPSDTRDHFLFANSAELPKIKQSLQDLLPNASMNIEIPAAIYCPMGNRKQAIVIKKASREDISKALASLNYTTEASVVASSQHL